jgi:Mg-chelatase subunit ChlD
MSAESSDPAGHAVSRRRVAGIGDAERSNPSRAVLRTAGRRPAAWIRGRLVDRRGAVLAFVGVIMVVLLGFVGLALDSARGYVARSRLSRAVDAAALGGARALRQGQDVATARARTLAAANGASADRGVSLSIWFDQNALGENVIHVSASETLPTMFMRVLGRTSMDVRSQAAAAVAPLDLILVLDQSGSLDQMGAFDELQDAAKRFVEQFSESIDQVGLVSFQVKAADHFLIDHPFKLSIRSKIDQMKSAGDTNSREGLRYGYNQLKSARVRPKAVKIVVFFTDGRPTAFRGVINGKDRVEAVYVTKTGKVRGYFDNPDALPINQIATASGCKDVASCFGMNEDAVRTKARTDAEAMAGTIRQDKIFIFSIGLGNPAASDPLLVPDMDFLRRVANENGMVSSSQPAGKAYFAPSAAELDTVFQEVAQNILVRLSE